MYGHHTTNQKYYDFFFLR